MPERQEPDVLHDSIVADRLSTPASGGACLADGAVLASEQLKAIEQEDSGLLQTLVLRSQADPAQVFVVVVFESEEKARSRDQDPRRQEPLEGIRASMGDVLNGPSEFFDCDVLLNR